LEKLFFKLSNQLVTALLNFGGCPAASDPVKQKGRVVANIVSDQLPETIAVTMQTECHQTVFRYRELTNSSLIHTYLIQILYSALTRQLLVLELDNLIDLVTFFNFTFSLLDSV